MVFVFFITLLVKMPAAIVVKYMPKSNIKIDNVTGTIWQGQAKQVVVNREVNLQNVKWDLQPMALLKLTLEAAISFNNGPQAMSGKGLVAYGFSGASASNIIFDLTSKELITLLPMRLPATITGNFSGVIKQVSQGNPYCEQLEGNILWHDAVVYSQFGNINLDTPSIDLGCENGNVSIFVTQESDELITNLDINLGENGVYQLNGEIQGTDRLAPNIADSLTWIGPKNESGATTLSFSGQL